MLKEKIITISAVIVATFLLLFLFSLIGTCIPALDAKDETFAAPVDSSRAEVGDGTADWDFLSIDEKIKEIGSDNVDIDLIDAVDIGEEERFRALETLESDLAHVAETLDAEEDEGQCIPECEIAECGDDGCGGMCGECKIGFECVDGLCECLPDCTGKECGDNGCGGICGECAQGFVCNDSNLCICQPMCDAQECGLDPFCGESCGECEEGTNSYCGDDLLCHCDPDCAGKECGDDGCGINLNCGICFDVDPLSMCNLITYKCEIGD